MHSVERYRLSINKPLWTNQTVLCTAAGAGLQGSNWPRLTNEWGEAWRKSNLTCRYISLRSTIYFSKVKHILFDSVSHYFHEPDDNLGTLFSNWTVKHVREGERIGGSVPDPDRCSQRVVSSRGKTLNPKLPLKAQPMSVLVPPHICSLCHIESRYWAVMFLHFNNPPQSVLSVRNTAIDPFWSEMLF